MDPSVLDSERLLCDDDDDGVIGMFS